jgi:hypothetical protein
VDVCNQATFGRVNPTEKVEALHMELATELVVRGSTAEAPLDP